jgi:hypothetical protein
VQPYPSWLAFELHDDVDLRCRESTSTVAAALRNALAAATELDISEPSIPLSKGTIEIASASVGYADRCLQLFEAIRCDDALLMRSLGPLVKAPMLATHFCFHTEACMSLHVAMEASGEIIRRTYV